MINKGSGLENTLEEELKDIDEKMSHYDVMIKNLTEENKVLQNEIPQLQNKQLEMTNQLKVIKQITEPY
jgi:predicted RNase H-like nuclease (RuvC/YqgF family)